MVKNCVEGVAYRRTQENCKPESRNRIKFNWKYSVAALPVWLGCVRILWCFGSAAVIHFAKLRVARFGHSICFFPSADPAGYLGCATLCERQDSAEPVSK